VIGAASLPAALLLGSLLAAPSVGLPARDVTAARAFYLDPLVHPHDYVPGKTSFVFQGLRRGERRTLLDVEGAGSVRHLWLTWCRSFEEPACATPGRARLRVYVDGEAEPSLEGTVDDLFEAAAATGGRYVPQPAFVADGTFNLYLPIFFGRGARLEVEALEDLAELYAQVDYRITPRTESRARLLSERAGDGVRLRYLGEGAPHVEPVGTPPLLDVRSERVELPPGSAPVEIRLRGPGTIRRLSFLGDVGDLSLAIHWDEEQTPSVSVPLRYLFDRFSTLALESQGDLHSVYFPMPFRRQARIRLSNSSPAARALEVTLAVDRRSPVESHPLRFHALLAEEASTTGYADFVVLSARGEGHFVGLSLFDSGHNHGGGDTALMDADTERPLVLHGVCGEDYFSFAWHRTGAMHDLAGAPAHEARYRFHLENPYPFKRSLLFTFGIFAGQHPRSVAFWYQRPATGRSGWRAPSVPFKVLGPMESEATPPETVDGRSYPVEVSLARPERFAVQWEDATSRDGFLDLTHHFRHYVMTEKGTGFVTGAVRARAETCLFAPAAGRREVLVGHDDAVQVAVGGSAVARLDAEPGFRASPLAVPLRKGWNRLSFVLDNAENVDWRWFGLSLSLRDAAVEGLRFAAPPCPTTP
jgi:hypothetical protein